VPPLFIYADLNVYFLCSFSWFLREKKEKEPKEKRTLGGNSRPYTVLMPPKSTGGIFTKFVGANFVKRRLCFSFLVGILNPFCPLTRPNTTVGFLNEPKGYIQIAGIYL